MRGFAEYAIGCILIIAIVGAIAWTLATPAGRHMVIVSAALALGIQLVAFTVARLLQRRNLLLGWGLGSMLRVVAVVLYALLAARVWQASIAPALISFVAFLFLTTIVEPVFLKR